MGATSNVKLNKQVDITGWRNKRFDLATGNNIGVTSALLVLMAMQNYKLQLAKNLTGLPICNGIRHCESRHRHCR